MLVALLARPEAHVIRLAMILALVDLEGAIEARHLRAALSLYEYSEASCMQIFGGKAEALLDRIKSTLLRAAPLGRTLSELHKALGNHVQATELRDALGCLERQGVARCEPAPNRRGQTWFISNIGCVKP